MSRTGLFLLAGLLLLRLPFVLLGSALRLPHFDDIYYVGTYWLTLILIWQERDRLRQYHLGMAAVALVFLGPTLEWCVKLAINDPTAFLPVRWLEIVPGLLLAAALLTKGSSGRAEGRAVWKWAIAALPIGLTMAAVTGLVGRLQETQIGHQVIPLARVALLFTIQLTRAATYEEPLFRGFLWGALRQRCWGDRQIWLLQTGLFWVGHLFYFPKFPVSLWLVVPAGGALTGFLAWRSRSIVPGMIAHAIWNATGIFFSTGQWL